MLVDEAPAEEGGDQEQQAEDRGPAHVVRPHHLHVEAHEHRDRDRRPDRERAPWALPQRVDDDEREHGDQDDHDREHADQGGEAAERTDLLLRHLAERAAVVAEAAAENAEILHRAAEDDAGEDPERPGQIAELRRQRRPDQRARAGDGGEVVAEDDPAIGGNEVAAVVDALGGSGIRGVEREELGGDEGAVEAVGDRVDRDRGDDEPDGVDGLAARGSASMAIA